MIETYYPKYKSESPLEIEPVYMSVVYIDAESRKDRAFIYHLTNTTLGPFPTDPDGY